MEIPTPVPATGTHFYRYSGLQRIDWLKPILLEHKLYLPSVSQLNDPVDGRPLLAPLSEEKMFGFLYNATRNPTLTRDAQEKVIRTLSYNIQHHGPEELRREMAKILNKQLQDYRIYSMSKRYDNLSLWAKYADGHRGYCLEFANEGELFEHTVEVIYGESIPMDVTIPKQRTGYFLYCKRKEWSNEEEVRLIRMRGARSTVKIDPCWLTRLILGTQVTEDHEKTIREWCGQRKPELTVVKAYFDELDQKLKLRA